MRSGPVPAEQAVILVLATFGRDGPTLAETVAGPATQVRLCASGDEICAAFNEATSAILITEESLPAAAETLLRCLRSQAPWSDVPVIILSGGQGRSGTPARWEYFRRFGNVTVLARPLSREALRIALEAACRARAWQYVVRDQMHKLEGQNIDLEHRVRERTQALQEETGERKRIEAALNEARRLEAIGRLAGGVAHDFNNLLQVVSSACDLLLHTEADPVRTKAVAQTIMRAAERGSRLTQQMLAFGRRQVLSSEALDIARHVLQLKDLLQHALREGVTLEMRLAPDLWHAHADATQLEVALLNLVVNARDALPPGGTVTLTADNVRLPAPQVPEAVDLSGEFVWLAVADNGPGMSPEVAANAFEPFFTTKRVGEGSGLGLSQVYGFASQSGGAAWISTSPGGTTVSILLPRGTAASSGEEVGQDEEGSEPGRLFGLRVVCVEDDEAVGEAAVALLHALGCSVDRARSADEALQREFGDYDLVFSDVKMPGSMDGIDLAWEIAKRQPALPVVLASGYVVAPQRLRELQVRLITKPYDIGVLRRALLECIDSLPETRTTPEQTRRATSDRRQG